MSEFYFGHKIVETVEECINFCLETPGCKSVDYGNIETCLLNYVNRTDRQLLIGCDNKNGELFDYYEIVCDSECPSEKPKPPPEEDVCMNAPLICKNSGICETVQVPPPGIETDKRPFILILNSLEQAFVFHCSCPCNYCGPVCDTCKYQFSI